MSKMRPTLIDSKNPGLDYSSTFFRVAQAVRRRRRLLHGRLKDQAGETCAVGSYFEEAAGIPLDTAAIDEIAAYNDSFPRDSPAQRWRKVNAWLRFRLKALELRRNDV